MNSPTKFALSMAIIFSLLGLGELAAQSDEGQAGNGPSVGKKGPQFTCLYWEGLPEEDLYYRLGEEFVLLQFSKEIRSRGFSLKGMSVFELYRDAQKPVEGKPPYDKLTQAKIPTGTSQVLFLVIPFNGEGKTTYRVVAMDDSLSAFPRGTFRFANFTSQALFVKFAGEVQKLPSSKMTVMSCKPGEAGGFRPFLIGDAKGRQVFGTRLFGQASGRELVFISPPERKGSKIPRVKFISQLIGKPVVKPSQ